MSQPSTHPLMKNSTDLVMKGWRWLNDSSTYITSSISWRSATRSTHAWKQLTSWIKISGVWPVPHSWNNWTSGIGTFVRISLNINTHISQTAFLILWCACQRSDTSQARWWMCPWSSCPSSLRWCCTPARQVRWRSDLCPAPPWATHSALGRQHRLQRKEPETKMETVEQLPPSQEEFVCLSVFNLIFLYIYFTTELNVWPSTWCTCFCVNAADAFPCSLQNVKMFNVTVLSLFRDRFFCILRERVGWTRWVFP